MLQTASTKFNDGSLPDDACWHVFYAGLEWMVWCLMSRMKHLQFTDDGRRYVVRDVHALDKADADLGNDSMTIHLDHRGRVIQAGFLQPDMTSYSEPSRVFYVRDDDSGRFWSAPFEPVQTEPDIFEFSIGLADLQWNVIHDGLRIQLRLVVPRDANVELWTATLTNVSRQSRRVSLYSYLPVGVAGLLAQHSWYDPAQRLALHEYFPYYVHFADLPKLRRWRNAVFCASDVRPDAHELSIAQFVGRHGLHHPDQLRVPRLRGVKSKYEVANERAASIFQYRRRLKPGQSFTVNLVFGPAHDRAEAIQISRRYRRKGGIESALNQCHRFLEEHAPDVRIQTPDAAFDHYINHWQARRSLMLARCQRYTLAPQGRNVIQDSMGGIYVDPASSRQWFLRIWAHQHANGWLPHGMPFAPDVRQVPINSIPHKDINSWGPVALSCYVTETGDYDILEQPVPFADQPSKTASLYEHISLGLEWLLRDRTPRGLSRIGQGDWNDPLNMAGHHEKGESVWLSQALAHALDVWADLADHRHDTQRANRWRTEAVNLRRAINRLAWDGRWYRRGFTDAGRPFGTHRDREGTVFINSQSWAIISGAANRKRARLCIRAVEQHLMTPAGPMTLAPPFTTFRADIGKLTQKIPGWNENGSVYCHAATFYAYALYVAREADKGFAALRQLLPGGGTNTIQRAGQVPLYIPNFYRGAAAGRHAGLSSHAPNTGTASWYYRTVVAMLFGIRAEHHGLRIDPQLPSHWNRARVWRRWRGAEFDVRIKRDRARRGVTVMLDGQVLRDNLIPIQPAGAKRVVQVVIGR